MGLTMITINAEIQRLVQFGLKHNLLWESDRVFAVNRILSVLKLTEFSPAPIAEEEFSCAAPILNNILDWAFEHGLLAENTTTYRDLFDTELMACIMPRPSEVIHTFDELYQKDKKSATDYYYDLSRSSNYIRVDRVAKDKLWTTSTEYGDMIITINLSKPEKDPKAIAAARNAVQSGYPKCALCRENEGFSGSFSQAPRGNHRLIPIDLCGERWFLQYSPYVYYNEHCIILKETHTPMKVSRASFEHLLEFVTLFPHYFIGSNADLPIVGGSILTHDHFQGGNFEFPMMKAAVYRKIQFLGYGDVDAGLVRWPMSVIRLSGTNKVHLCDLADKILTEWRGYSDEQADIFAFSGETPHNTVTPIARRCGELFELDLVLRNNRTTAEHPLGIFHPHTEYHHIKKENIGLIEVMGLAILPARLKNELEQLESCLKNSQKESELFQDENMQKHLDWYKELKARHFAPQDVHAAVQQEVGTVFAKVLGNAGVYKDTIAGKAAFLRFVDYVNSLS